MTSSQGFATRWCQRVILRAATAVLGAFLAVSAVAAAPTPAIADDGVIAEWSGDTLLGVAQNNWHWWGTCRIRDFNGGAWGWYQRASNGVYAQSFHVRHGMLQGWVAVGGGPVIGCPLSDQFSWKGGRRQNFTKGYLYWRSGMSRAIGALNGTPTRFALDHLGEYDTPLTVTHRWSGWCLRYVMLAQGKSSSYTGAALSEWKLAVKLGKAHPGDLRPPRGAAVYYAWGSLGHAGVHLGDGWVVSTKGTEYDRYAVRMARIDGIGLTYLGWAPRF